MNISTIVLIFTLLLNAFIIYLVYKSNPKRLINRIFSYLVANIWLWNLTVLFIVESTTIETTAFWIQMAFAVGSFVPLLLLSLVYSITGEKRPFFRRKDFLIMLVLSFCCFSVSFLPNFFTSLKQPEVVTVQNVPEATYGWPFFVFFILFVTVGFYALGVLFKNLKQKRGLSRAELQYILLGCSLGLLFVCITNFLFPVIFKTSVLVQFAPVGALIMNGIIGYGIARYKIMDVSVVMRRVLAYSLLILSIFLLYNLLLFSFKQLFFYGLPAESILPETLVLLVIVFVFEPLRNRINNFVNFKIFNLEYSPEDTLKGLERVLYTVGDIRTFLERCLKIVLEGVGVKEGKIFFTQTEGYGRHFVISQSLQGTPASEDYAYPVVLEKVFKERHTPLVKGELERRIPEEKNIAIIKEMQQLNAEMAIPLLSDNKLIGILCFGEKVSGKFFSPEDEEVFSRLSYYLSLKVQNFLFYEQLERERRYQETLLENLPIGVIGTDADGYINIFNREAEKITGLDKIEIEGKNFAEVFPEEIRKILMYSIQYKKDLRHIQFKMKKDGGELSLSANASLFYSKEGELTGAQMIFSDVTHLEELEEGIKRAERLASLGVMATGIAHEIKNPLVSIKTFAQLLQEKYNDKDFREQFSSLAIREVDRINALVEDILVFAKPRGIVWEDVDIKEVIKATVVLLLPQFPDKKIEIKESFSSEPLVIKGDADKLKQALLNVCINSVQAIDREGVIEIKAEKEEDMVRIAISDNGCGIKRDVLDKIFEPFFTTKGKGTGLGLSIVARIIDEHKGGIKVDSVEGKGTTVFIELPVKQKESQTDELFGTYNGK